MLFKIKSLEDIRLTEEDQYEFSMQDSNGKWHFLYVDKELVDNVPKTYDEEDPTIEGKSMDEKWQDQQDFNYRMDQARRLK